MLNLLFPWCCFYHTTHDHPNFDWILTHAWHRNFQLGLAGKCLFIKRRIFVLNELSRRFTSDRSLVHANVSITVLSLPLKLNEIAEPHSNARKTAKPPTEEPDNFILRNLNYRYHSNKSRHYFRMKTFLRDNYFFE